MVQDQELNQDQGAMVQSSPQEKMIPQSKVDEIVHNRTAEVAEKARAKAFQEFQSQQGQQQHSMGGMSQPSHEQIERLIASKLEQHQNQANQAYMQHQQQQEGQRVVGEFVNKIEAGKSKYPDLDKKLSGLPLKDIPHVIHMSNLLDNTADVMNELADNPSKIATIHGLHAINPELAFAEMRKLSDSIKTNQEASSVKTANDPLSQVTPSTVGTDSGSMSGKDYKNASWLRG